MCFSFSLQQLVDLVKALQEKLIEEKRKMQTLEMKIREEVCKEMAEQLVAIENAYRQDNFLLNLNYKIFQVSLKKAIVDRNSGINVCT